MIRLFRTSWPVLICCAVTILTVVRNGNTKWMNYDALGYYAYLPQAFLKHDLKIKDPYEIEREARESQEMGISIHQFNYHENGNHSIKYPVGVALLQLPFFAGGHVSALLMGEKCNGYTLPYRIAVTVGHIFYVMLGLWLLHLSLLRFFRPWIAATCTLAIGLFTNLFIQATSGILMSHGPLFALEMAVLWFTLRIGEEHQRKHYVMLGLTLGMLAVTRHSEVLLVLVPLLWGVSSFQSAREKFRQGLVQWKRMLPLVLAAALPVLVQMAYWWHVTGFPIVYAYTNNAEGFDFLTPHTFNSLFHPQSGVFLYNPLLLAGLFGFLVWRRMPQPYLVAVPVYLLVTFYLISSWSVWSYGFRAFSQTYGYFGIGLAMLLTWVDAVRHRWVKWVSAVFLGLMAVASAFYHFQYYAGTID